MIRSATDQKCIRDAFGVSPGSLQVVLASKSCLQRTVHADLLKPKPCPKSPPSREPPIPGQPATGSWRHLDGFGTFHRSNQGDCCPSKVASWPMLT